MVVFGSLTVETFRSEVGNMFWVDTVPKPVRIKLIRLKEGVPTLRDFRIPFSLIFATPRDTLLLEGTYDFKSESGREFRQVFMAPIQSSGPMQEYQVLHN
ncbi:hypothetical protein JL100_024220 [Skermanella mucosa]|uniref:DUF6916 family protein n=1 Tax=Skermanella mucosa TaxID=1789672 RepID=UPI00192C8AFF|nr:hypothetical protein [Skermanella mucosa]UEM20149.1 hypothetical protein JL100_024220 [Skermanella mucosa]